VEARFLDFIVGDYLSTVSRNRYVSGLIVYETLILCFSFSIGSFVIRFACSSIRRCFSTVDRGIVSFLLIFPGLLIPSLIAWSICCRGSLPIALNASMFFVNIVIGFTFWYIILLEKV
jgi:hypothetical protein